MGYYSNVCITLYEKDFKNLYVKANKECPEACEILEKCDDFRKSSSNKFDQIVTLYWEGIKWYKEYAGVGFIMDYIRSGVPYCFKRIGESYEDIEYEEDLDENNYLYWSSDILRSIELNDPVYEPDFQQILNEAENLDEPNDSSDKSSETDSEKVLLNLMENYFHNCEQNGYSDFGVWCEDNIENDEQESLVYEIKEHVNAIAGMLF